MYTIYYVNDWSWMVSHNMYQIVQINDTRAYTEDTEIVRAQLYSLPACINSHWCLPYIKMEGRCVLTKWWFLPGHNESIRIWSWNNLFVKSSPLVLTSVNPTEAHPEVTGYEAQLGILYTKRTERTTQLHCITDKGHWNQKQKTR